MKAEGAAAIRACSNIIASHHEHGRSKRSRNMSRRRVRCRIVSPSLSCCAARVGPSAPKLRHTSGTMVIAFSTVIGTQPSPRVRSARGVPRRSPAQCDLLPASCQSNMGSVSHWYVGLAPSRVNSTSDQSSVQATRAAHGAQKPRPSPEQRRAASLGWLLRSAVDLLVELQIDQHHVLKRRRAARSAWSGRVEKDRQLRRNAAQPMDSAAPPMAAGAPAARHGGGLCRRQPRDERSLLNVQQSSVRVPMLASPFRSP